jgi:inhibitor of KinA
VRSSSGEERRWSARFLAIGDRGLTIELGDAIDPVVNTRVHRLAADIRAALGDEVEEVVPTYRSLLVVFDPLQIARAKLIERIDALLTKLNRRAAKDGGTGRVIEIPVCYGGEYGPDLEFVAQHNGLTPDEVIAIHGEPGYRVFMIGFTPGFPYLGGMSARIAAPRLDQPRPRIPAGTVGIAGQQTGIYSVESPGGWRLIGRTPMKMFDPGSKTPFPIAAGDTLKFKAVTPEEFARLTAAASAGGGRP